MHNINVSSRTYFSVNTSQEHYLVCYFDVVCYICLNKRYILQGYLLLEYLFCNLTKLSYHHVLVDLICLQEPWLTPASQEFHKGKY